MGSLSRRAPAAGQRVIDEQRAADDIFLRDEAPEAAVGAVGGIVTHGEI